MKLYRVAQDNPDFEGFHSEEVPQEIVNLVGTGGTSASQITMLFPQADKSIQLVNEFDSSLLADIAYIFNFTKSGAYGVYLDALDKTIKTEELKQALENSGYQVALEDGVLKAYPTQEQKTPEEIQQDIDVFYQRIEQEGGTSFGINMNSILSLSKDGANASNSPDPNLWEWIAILHVGSTIAHEATHAKGHQDEGMPQQVEAAFEQWALPKLNEEYAQYWQTNPELSQYEFSPIQFTGEKIHASGSGWYKEAQHFFQQMQFQNLNNSPKGSDLEGRFPSKPHAERGGRADYGLLMHMQDNWPIESRLSREFMFPLPEGVDQAHDIIEEQLTKYRQEMPHKDVLISTEELLSEQHDEDASYKAMETLLEEGRPSPLMLTLEKEASLVKEATTFGWMNNLEISDGNTIPGLGDRVMAWEDRDEDFAWTEDEIRSQPRYNPVKDIKGFFQRWIEPRFRPQLFDDMTRDFSNIHPARRFASTSMQGADEARAEMLQIMSILSCAKEKIVNNIIRATRLIVSDDMLPILHELFDITEDVNLYVRKIDDEYSTEEVYVAWLTSPTVDYDRIVSIEDRLRIDPFDSKVHAEIDNICCYSKIREKLIQDLIIKIRRVCRKHKMKNIFIVGGYPRAVMMKEPMASLGSLSFTGTSKHHVRKLASVLAKEFGIEEVYYGDMVTAFDYKGLFLEFNSRFQPEFIQDMMIERDIKINSFSVDVFNRDFTMNMLAYNIVDKTLYDISKRGIEDIEKRMISTYFDPSRVLEENPILILRALYLKLKYDFDISENLKYAMYICGEKLFDGNISTDILIAHREQILQEGREEAIELFTNYGLEEIFKY